MSAEISAECLLSSKKYSSAFKDSEQEDLEVCALSLPCMTNLPSNIGSPNIMSELCLSNNFRTQIISITYRWSIIRVCLNYK